MKSLVIAASLIASVLVGTVGVSAAERFDGRTFFEDISRRAGL